SGTIISIATQLVFSATADAPQLPRRVVYASTKAFLFMFVRLLAQELQDTGIRLQVVCPGVVRTEFHTRQGMDMSHVPRFEPDDVVQASLRGLELGELVCIPGLEDVNQLASHEQAEVALLLAGLRPPLATRYKVEGGSTAAETPS